MAIWGIGAWFGDDGDVSQDFIRDGYIGLGWDINEAPDLFKLYKRVDIGDIVYIKAAAYGAQHITVKAVGVITSDKLLQSYKLATVGKEVSWVDDQAHIIGWPQHEKYNYRSNSIYEEIHTEVQEKIVEFLLQKLQLRAS